MRPAYVAALFLAIGLILLAISFRKGEADGGGTEISRRVRRRTGSIFILVAVGLVVLDLIR